MVWIKSELRDELAVVFTWLALLVPWNVAYHTDGPLGSHIAFLRLSVCELQLRFPAQITLNDNPVDVAGVLAARYTGVQLYNDLYVTVPPAGASQYTGQLAAAHFVWSVGALIMIGLFCLSIGMYLREDRTQARLPIAYHRLVGAGLLVVTGLFAVTTGLFYLERTIVGVPIPAGLVLIGLFGVLLLRAAPVDGTAPRESGGEFK